MVDRAIDDKSPDTLVVVSGEGFWTGSSTLPHLHQFFVFPARPAMGRRGRPLLTSGERLPSLCLPSYPIHLKLR